MKAKLYSKASLMLALMITPVLVPTAGMSAQDNNSDLPQPGLAPGNWLYGVERSWENMTLFFAGSAASQKQIEYAEERVAEAEKLASKEEGQNVSQALEEYERHVKEAAKNASQAGEDTLSRVAQATTNHQAALTRMQDKVSSETQSSIKSARSVSLTERKQALSALTQKNSPKGTKVSIDTFRKDIEQMNEVPDTRTRASRLQTSLQHYQSQLQEIRRASQTNPKAAQEASTQTSDLIVKLNTLAQRDSLSEEDRQSVSEALQETSSTHIEALRIHANTNPQAAAQAYRDNAQTLKNLRDQAQSQNEGSNEQPENVAEDSEQKVDILRNQEDLAVKYQAFGKEMSTVAQQVEGNTEVQKRVTEARATYKDVLADVRERVQNVRERAREQQQEAKERIQGLKQKQKEQHEELQNQAERLQDLQQNQQERQEEIQNEMENLKEQPSESPAPEDETPRSGDNRESQPNSTESQTQSGQTSAEANSEAGESTVEIDREQRSSRQ